MEAKTFKKGEKIGGGAYGVVYSATAEEGSEVAVKRNLSLKLINFIGSIRELDIMTKLNNHAHIIKLIDVINGDPFPGRVLSPVVGNHGGYDLRSDNIHFVTEKATCDLFELIYNGYPGYKAMKIYMLHLLLGVEYMHSRGLLHRDIKPDNMLIVNGVLKLCDFGMAKPYCKKEKNTPHAISPWYCSPEVAIKDFTYDYGCDDWSVGCVLFEMINRKALFYQMKDDPEFIINKYIRFCDITVEDEKYIRENIYTKVNINLEKRSKTKKTVKQRIGLEGMQEIQFATQAGNLNDFSYIVKNLLTFDRYKRGTVSDALNNGFFDEFRPYIENLRSQTQIDPVKGLDRKTLLGGIPPFPSFSPSFSPSGNGELRKEKEEERKLPKIKEREWAIYVICLIFNNRPSLPWYSHRAFFQSIDMFSRYLHYLIKERRDKNGNEGLGYLTERQTHLRYLTCFYMSVKYFSTVKGVYSFPDVVSEIYRGKETLLEVEQFERKLINEVFQRNIYRETEYERFDEKDNEYSIVNLLTECLQ